MDQSKESRRVPCESGMLVFTREVRPDLRYGPLQGEGEQDPRLMILPRESPSISVSTT
jgi:hypothetical protein